MKQILCQETYHTTFQFEKKLLRETAEKHLFCSYEFLSFFEKTNSVKGNF